MTPERLSYQPLDSISLDRVADLLRDSDTEPCRCHFEPRSRQDEYEKTVGMDFLARPLDSQVFGTATEPLMRGSPNGRVGGNDHPHTEFGRWSILATSSRW